MRFKIGDHVENKYTGDTWIVVGAPDSYYQVSRSQHMFAAEPFERDHWRVVSKGDKLKSPLGLVYEFVARTDDGEFLMKTDSGELVLWELVDVFVAEPYEEGR